MSLGTQLGTNFLLKAPLPNFDRDVIDTYEELISVDRKGEYAQGHIVYCNETDSYYSYTEVDTEEMGFFKPLSLGGGGGISFELPSDKDYSDFDYVTSNPGENEGEEGGDDTEGGENGDVGDGEGTEEPGSDIPEDEPTDEGTETN